MLFLCLSMALSQLLAQNRTLKGKITDDKGNAIPHASVLVKGTTIGTTAGVDGSFTLNVPPSAKTLVISSLNFTAQEVVIGSKTVLNIILQSAVQNLDEVVVVGYGSQKKSDVTSSVTKVGGEKVANVPFSSFDQTLQGKAAGVQSVTFSGQPGANQSIRIRGIGSYSASAQPLFVVDGIQINSGDLSRETTTSNVLAQLNPDDIDNLVVLKDAAATALYGARGGNGVIVVTTKRGKIGKTKFTASTEVGNNTHGDLPAAGKPVRANDWVTLFKEGILNAGYSQATADATATTYGAGLGVDADWVNLVTRTGTQQQYNVNASGGDSKTQFFISGGYFKQEAATIGSDLRRYSSVINIDHIVNNKLSFSINLQPTYSRQTTFISNSSAFSNPTMEMYFLRPLQNPFNADGTYNIVRATKDFSSLYNPLFIVANDIHSLDNFSTIGKGQIKYNILNNLKFTSSVGLQYNNLEEYYYNNPLEGDGYAANGRGYSYYTRYFLYDVVNQLDYHANLDKNHDLTLDAYAGYEAISSKGYFINAQSQNFPTPTLVASATAATPTIANNNGSDYNFASLFSKASIAFKGKYIISGSVRRDGSSRFSDNNQYGIFPAGSIAWNVSKEKFMSRASWITDLKVRASYGATGNAEIGNYTWRQTLGYGLTYNNQPGGGFNSIGNTDLRWEKQDMADIGFDLMMFKNRVNIIFDWYDKKSSDLLFTQPISMVTGFTGITRNIGAVENKGIELTVNATPIQKKNFSWDISFNITNNKNKITKIPDGQTQIINGIYIVAPGHDIQEFYMRQWAGVDPANGNPLWYTDAKKTATTSSYNAAAAVPTGVSASPKYYGGFGNTFTYREFSLSADFYYNFGNYVRDGWAAYFYDQINPTYGKYAYNLNRWQKAGDITDVPKPIYGGTNFSSSTSTRFLFKGDFIRLRNLTLAYNAKQSLVNSLHLTSLKFYMRGTNLWTKTYDNRLPFDPEQGVTSASNLNVMYNKSFTVGLNIGF
ncbi:TonB-dependent receptor SusC precursor [mine drainage metagenome]|uniref:TonB-dependent receptor SusC n=1 Tax=mine drainage metagenome TaxID=410659 RepID=A0A1J5SVP2_9ZZZZ